MPSDQIRLIPNAQRSTKRGKSRPISRALRLQTPNDRLSALGLAPGRIIESDYPTADQKFAVEYIQHENS